MTIEKSRPVVDEAAPKAFGGADIKGTTASRTEPSSKPTENGIIEDVTATYLAELDRTALPSARQIEQDLIDRVNKEFIIDNVARLGGDKFRLLKQLTHKQVALILVELHKVVAVNSSRTAPDSGLDGIAIWQPSSGIYTQDIEVINKVASRYNNGSTIRFQKEVFAKLREEAPHVRREVSGKWAAVANGDYNRSTGELEEASPERVFLTRTPVKYVFDAKNTVIHNDEDGTDWDVDSGLMDIANGDPETLQLIWEMFAAVAQPQVRTNRAIALYNPVGNNGKGTLLAVAANLVGEQNCLKASLSDLGKDTTQALIPGKALIASDENATNDFVKFAEVIKKLATRETLLINPKYIAPYNGVFEGNQIHCLNGLLRIGDHSDSLWRRWIFIPLLAEFEDVERMYIKDDYIKRPEVLEYLLRRSLEMDFTKFTETKTTRDLMTEMKLHNDPVRRFWDEHRKELVWNMQPMEFLYDMYKAWSTKNKPNGRAVDRSQFDDNLRAAVNALDDEWTSPGKGERMKAASRMIGVEPLVKDYELPSQWHLRINPQKQFRNVLYRDPIARVLASPLMAAMPAPSGPVAKSSAIVAAEHVLHDVERLVAEELEWWQKQAVEEDGVTRLDHVAEHALIRRLGTSCKCPPRSGTGHQRAYSADVHQRSRHLDVALLEAREALEESAA
jgi:putative DNA primase/helicase